MLQESFIRNWDRPALSNYKGEDFTYGQIAEKIEKMHLFFKGIGIKPGDKVAISSKNCVNWAVTFLSTITYGAVAVPILHEFKPANIAFLVNHSDAALFYVSEQLWESIGDIREKSGELKAVVSITDFSLIRFGGIVEKNVRENLDEMFSSKFKYGVRPEDLDWYVDTPDELALINYTSGTSGFSKGVMLPYRSLVSNILFAGWAEPQMDNTSNMLSILPTAHMYGLLFEFLFEMTIGAHTYFLQKTPSPRIITSAMMDVKPATIIAVPMIIEKIYKKKLQPFINKGRIKMLMSLPLTDSYMKKKLMKRIYDSFGGAFGEVIVGGASFNREAEDFFRKISFPFTIGYGMTECGPIISYAPWSETRLYSCGQAAPRMEIRINSTDPKTVPGEILVRGDNVFLGYYKNEKATFDAFTAEGWFKTGDLGVIDDDGFLYIKGRNKSMILGPSGQNIYPEEIESYLNNMPYVIESLVIEDSGKLVALVYPDFDRQQSDGLSGEDLKRKMEEVLEETNREIPSYSQLSSIEIFPEEFEKTPKKSIKRYLYQRK